MHLSAELYFKAWEEMRIKKQAEELINKMRHYTHPLVPNTNNLAYAKACAIIAVDFAKSLQTEKSEDLYLMIPFNDQKQYDEYLQLLKDEILNYGKNA